MIYGNGHSSYNIGAMQQDAQRRVYEMQRRAQMAVVGENSDSFGRMQRNEPYTRISSQYVDAQDYIPNKTQLEEATVPKEDGCEREEKKHDVRQNGLPIAELAAKDSERVLLLLLILLLSSQSCDPMLLLALLYIA